MRIQWKQTFAAILIGLAAASGAQAASRIKDVVEVEGVRGNQLVGYGIVVGLNGTGDTVRNSPMLKQSMEAMMERLGINVRDANLNTKNAAAVMVTAELPPSPRLGRGSILPCPQPVTPRACSAALCWSHR